MAADVQTERLAAVMVLAQGGQVELPSLDERLAEFDERLAAAPKRVGPEELELRQALGLR